MKVNKPDSTKKTSKKAEKKALEQSLTAKLFEAVKSLGHDAEKIGEDLILVSKFVAKKISKRVKPVKQEAVKVGKKQAKKVAAQAVPDTDHVDDTLKISSEPKAGLAKRDDSKIKTKSTRAPKKSEAVLKKAAAKPIATVSSVKVNIDPFVEEASAPAEEVKASTPAVVKSAKVSKPAQKKAKPASGDDKEHIN
jgi:uncharacterized protein YicC (UPF0701 family)